MEARGHTPLSNMHHMRWDEDVCTEPALSTELLPDIGWATEVAGEISAEAAKETRLSEGTAVIRGTCDAHAEKISVGMIKEGVVALQYGTTMSLGVLTYRLRAHPGLYAPPAAIPNKYSLAGTMSTSDALTTWFRDNFGQAGQEGEARVGTTAYELLEGLAASVPPGSQGWLSYPISLDKGLPCLTRWHVR